MVEKKETREPLEVRGLSESYSVVNRLSCLVKNIILASEMLLLLPCHNHPKSPPCWVKLLCKRKLASLLRCLGINRPTPAVIPPDNAVSYSLTMPYYIQEPLIGKPHATPIPSHRKHVDMYTSQPLAQLITN